MIVSSGRHQAAPRRPTSHRNVRKHKPRTSFLRIGLPPRELTDDLAVGADTVLPADVDHQRAEAQAHAPAHEGERRPHLTGRICPPYSAWARSGCTPSRTLCRWLMTRLLADQPQTRRRARCGRSWLRLLRRLLVQSGYLIAPPRQLLRCRGAPPAASRTAAGCTRRSSPAPMARRPGAPRGQTARPSRCQRRRAGRRIRHIPRYERVRYRKLPWHAHSSDSG